MVQNVMSPPSLTLSGEMFVFLTLGDETDLAQVTATPDVYEKCGQTVFGGSLLAITGVAERRGAGTLLLAAHVREAR